MEKYTYKRVDSCIHCGSPIFGWLDPEGMVFNLQYGCSCKDRAHTITERFSEKAVKAEEVAEFVLSGGNGNGK